MSKEYSTLKAEFRSGSLIVTDPGPDFPPECNHCGLISRLNLLAENGWNVKSVSLNGTTLVFTIERTESFDKYTSQYAILMFQTYFQQRKQFPFGVLKRQYNETIQLWKELGWSEVKTVNLFSIDQETWVVSLMVQDWEQTDPKGLSDIKEKSE